MAKATTPALDTADQTPDKTETNHSRRWLPLVSAVGIVVLLGVILVGGFNLMYQGKILPGVSAEGVYLGGLTSGQAKAALASAEASFANQPITVNYNHQSLQLTARQLGVSYNDDPVVAAAAKVGRHGNWLDRLIQQGRAIVGRPTTFASYSYDDSLLRPMVQQIDEAVTVPVDNARLSTDQSEVSVIPDQTGRRLDLGRLTAAIGDRLWTLSYTPITAPVYSLPAAIDASSLSAVKDEAVVYLSSPITLTVGSTQQTINTADIAKWMGLNRPASRSFIETHQLADLYPISLPVRISVDQNAVESYVASLAQAVDAPAQDAALTASGGNVTIYQPSHDGQKLDQAATTTAIIKSISQTNLADRAVTATVTDIKPAVSEDSLSSLGITQLISEGMTTFPTYPAGRITNVKTGASRFNGVLLAPDETFSFNKILGPVDAAHGFAEGLVIADNTEEEEFGGGLCQVSTTMYRAALLAGLPITQRTNHSFVVSYYTSFKTTYLFGPNAGQTYSSYMPGLDATIYLPSPDFQFKNDTGHYILIQEVYSPGMLKFDFYGTATKYGAIRGPYAVSGDPSNSHVASTTVFYRDVFNLDGSLQHTDAVTTHYVSDLPFLPKS